MPGQMVGQEVEARGPEALPVVHGVVDAEAVEAVGGPVRVVPDEPLVAARQEGRADGVQMCSPRFSICTSPDISARLSASQA